MFDTLEYLKNAKHKVVGVKQTQKAVQRDQTDWVVMARDADPRVLRELQELCQAKGIALHWVETMQELGKAAGIQVGSATAAVLKE
ncbi:MAG: ribosomal L7Ae/L30e/S12e/Gadd45 family protein [Bacillota bacterium]|jgi:large subunit ribosomal protein L7A